MIRETVSAIVGCAITFVICAVAYPLAVWVIGWTIFPRQAAGSLIERDGKVVGSELIAQPFSSEKYFQPRPSAAGANGYAADAASGSNLGTKNPALRERISGDVAKLQEANLQEKEPVPADLVTTSGSGLDPNISVEGARYQAARVAAARGVTKDKIRAFIDDRINTSGAIIGAPARVNVLQLNLDLDRDFPAPVK